MKFPRYKTKAPMAEIPLQLRQGEVGTFNFGGRAFTNGGAYLGIDRRTGRVGGLLYAYPREGKVGSWDGKTKFEARFGNEWTNNMGDARQHVSFKIGHRRFVGTYYKSGGDIVRVREVK